MFEKQDQKNGARSGWGREKWLAYEEQELLRGDEGPKDEELPRQEEAQQGLKEQDAHFIQNLELRLRAYYGPALPAHPLSTDAWLRLRDQLNPPAQPRCRRSWHRPVPLEIQQLYATLLLQTNYRHPSPTLHIRFRLRTAQPRVSSDPLGRGRICLVLPGQSWQALHRAELDMLLAAGLARCSSVSRPFSLLTRAIFAMSLLLVLAVLPFTSVDRRAVWIFLVAVTCCLVSGRVLIWQQRAQAFRGDRIAVQWLGRERVCQGLHLLAEHGQPRRRPGWGEPSLAERIARVCGTPVTTKEKRLTLVS